jgi:hypothetical protein
VTAPQLGPAERGNDCEAREQNAASVRGYIGTLRANHQVEVQVERVAGQAQEEDAASVQRYTMIK